MPEFSYTAIDKNGIICKNKIVEESKIALIQRLKKNNLTPINVVQINLKKTTKKRININEDAIFKIAQEDIKKGRAQSRRKASAFANIKNKIGIIDKVSDRDLVVFTKNFYSLKRSGFNNIHALNTLAKSQENYYFKTIIQEILMGVESGENMYTTMEVYSNVFPYIYTNLIKVGELSGSLEESLGQAANFLDKTNELNKKLREILIPNIIQFVLLLIFIFIGSIYVIPIIQDVLTQVGSTAKLPAITIWFSHFMKGVQKYWFIPVSMIVMSIVGLIMYIKTPNGRYKWDYFKYREKIFGKLIFDIDMSRIIQAMLLNLNNGMRIQEALEVSKNVTKNYVMISIIEAAINNIIIGESWVKPFEESGIASPMIIEMLKTGMQSDLPLMMTKLDEYISEDIDEALTKIIKILPQILYLIVGMMIIFVTVVVLVPCVQMYMGGWLFSAAGV